METLLSICFGAILIWFVISLLSAIGSLLGRLGIFGIVGLLLGVGLFWSDDDLDE